MKEKITLHFYAKSTKSNRKGQTPIYVRLTIDGKRLEYSTKKIVDSSKWSSETGRMKGNSEEARSINRLLDFTLKRVNEIHFELLKDSQSVTIEAFKNKLLGIKERERLLMPISKEHHRKIKELIYAIKDRKVALELGIDLNKGIMLSEPIGCGKTSLMHLIKSSYCHNLIRQNE